VDRIIIEDLRLRCIVGVNPDERNQPRDVNLRITLCTDLRPAGSSDVLADTVDYSALHDDIRALVETSRFLLIERLAHEVARICLQRPGVERASVRLEKPGALRGARTVAVEIERTRADYAVP
jgi:dihydroneopterin aldolase/D-erythro-7,8-dihydroneopterin triphosphate epimerase